VGRSVATVQRRSALRRIRPGGLDQLRHHTRPSHVAIANSPLAVFSEMITALLRGPFHSEIRHVSDPPYSEEICADK
jgi:hypothetical protein